MARLPRPAPIELVINPNARRFVRRPALVDRLCELAGERARVSVTPDLVALSAAAQNIAAGRPERVVLCGGDGTFMAGVTALAEAYGTAELPELVLAPAGTVATVPRNWGQRADLLATVRQALAARSARAVRRPSLEVSADGKRRVGFIFGTGLVARFFDRYYAAGAGGYEAAARIVLRVFAGSFVGSRYARDVLEPLPCIIAVDGAELEPRAWSLVVASVVPNLGLHMLVTYRAGEDAKRPHLIASPLSTRELGPQAPRVLLGKPLRGSGLFDDLIGEARLAFPGDGGPWVLDGDIFHSKEVSLRAGPPLRVVTF